MGKALRLPLWVPYTSANTVLYSQRTNLSTAFHPFLPLSLSSVYIPSRRTPTNYRPNGFPPYNVLQQGTGLCYYIRAFRLRALECARMSTFTSRRLKLRGICRARGTFQSTRGPSSAMHKNPRFQSHLQWRTLDTTAHQSTIESCSSSRYLCL
jgi:hypothetical protein